MKPSVAVTMADAAAKAGEQLLHRQEGRLNRATHLVVDPEFLQELGVQCRSTRPAECEAQVSVPVWMGGAHESVQAVAQASLADYAAKEALRSVSDPGAESSVVDFKLKYVSPAPGAELRAVATVLRCSRGIAVVEVDVLSSRSKNAGAVVVAVAEVTFLVDDKEVHLPQESSCACWGPLSCGEI